MWDLLEIDPTNDLRAIKRAYAKKLKLARPDEKPKEFQVLNEAYQMAIEYAKSHAYDDIAVLEVFQQSDSENTGWSFSEELVTEAFESPTRSGSIQDDAPVDTKYGEEPHALLPEVEISLLDIDVSPPETEAPLPEVEISLPVNYVSHPENEAPLPEVEISLPVNYVSHPENEAPLPEVEISLPVNYVSHPETEMSLPEVDISNQETEVSEHSPETDVSPPEIYVDIGHSLATKKVINESQEQTLSEESELAGLITIAEALLKHKKRRQLIDNWSFLTETPSILDPYFNWELGKSILILLYDHRKKVHEDNMPIYEVNASVLFYMDGIFNWLENEDYLKNELDDKVCDDIFPSIQDYINNKGIYDEDRGIHSVLGAEVINKAEFENNRQILGLNVKSYVEQKAVNKVKRIFSILLDLAIISLPFILYYFSLHNFLHLNDQEISIVFIALYIIYLVIQYKTKYQATIGQRFLKIKVVVENNDPITFQTAFLRAFALIFNIILAGLFLLSIVTFKYFAIIPAIKIILWSYKSELTLHDRMTFTRVIDVET